MGNKLLRLSVVFLLLFISTSIRIQARDMIICMSGDNIYCLYKQDFLGSQKQARLLCISSESNAIFSFTELTGDPVDMVFHNRRLFIFYERNLMRYELKNNTIDQWKSFPVQSNVTIRGAGTLDNQLIAITSDQESLQALRVTNNGFDLFARLDASTFDTQSIPRYFVESTDTGIRMVLQNPTQGLTYLATLTQNTFSLNHKWTFKQKIRTSFTRNQRLVVVTIPPKTNHIEFHQADTESGLLTERANRILPKDHLNPNSISVLSRPNSSDLIFFYTNPNLEWFAVQKNTLIKKGETRIKNIEISLFRKTFFLITMLLIITLLPAGRISSRRIQFALAQGEQAHFFCPPWRRIAGFLIDAMIFFNLIGLFSIQAFLSFKQMNFFTPTPAQQHLVMSYFLFFILYGSLFEGLFGRTPGKFILGERVIDATHFGRCGIVRAFLRNLIPRLDIIMMLGVFSILFSRNKQSLRDLMARTAVVDNQTWIMHQQKESLTAY